MLVTPRIATCRATAPCRSINCGSRAAKKINALGLDACKMNPFSSIFLEDAVRGAAAAGETIDDSLKIVARPSQTRYAAPIHLIRKNRLYEAIRIEPRPVAETMK